MEAAWDGELDIRETDNEIWSRIQVVGLSATLLEFLGIIIGSEGGIPKPHNSAGATGSISSYMTEC